MLSFLEAGVAEDDERIRAAREWLQSHPRLDYSEGVPEDDSEAFGEVIYFYHLAPRLTKRSIGPETGERRLPPNSLLGSVRTAAFSTRAIIS